MQELDEIISAAASRADALATPDLAPQPRRRLAVLTCMDARIDVYRLLGLEPGDAHVLRNAGGLVTDDAIRSLSISQRALETESIFVIMHERCGLHGASDDDFAEALEADGATPSWRLGGFEDIEATLRAGLERLRSSPELASRDSIRGFIYDPATGRLREPQAER